MVDSFLQCELKALSAVRVKPGAEQRSLLRDEFETLGADRSVCSAARPAASRPRALVTSAKVAFPEAKFNPAKAAPSDELFGPFSGAAFARAPLRFISLDIQDRGARRGENHLRVKAEPSPRR